MIIEGVQLPSDAPPQVDVRIVSPDYFRNARPAAARRVGHSPRSDRGRDNPVA